MRRGRRSLMPRLGREIMPDKLDHCWSCGRDYEITSLKYDKCPCCTEDREWADEDA